MNKNKLCVEIKADFFPKHMKGYHFLSSNVGVSLRIGEKCRKYWDMILSFKPYVSSTKLDFTRKMLTCRLTELHIRITPILQKEKHKVFRNILCFITISTSS